MRCTRAIVHQAQFEANELIRAARIYVRLLNVLTQKSLSGARSFLLFSFYNATIGAVCIIRSTKQTMQPTWPHTTFRSLFFFRFLSEWVSLLFVVLKQTRNLGQQNKYSGQQLVPLHIECILFGFALLGFFSRVVRIPPMNNSSTWVEFSCSILVGRIGLRENTLFMTVTTQQQG